MTGKGEPWHMKKEKISNSSRVSFPSGMMQSHVMRWPMKKVNYS